MYMLLTSLYRLFILLQRSNSVCCWQLCLYLAVVRKMTHQKDTGVLAEPATEIIDSDQDGFHSEEDCDDTDPTIHPDAEEICDDIDNNCNDEVDENVTVTYFTDSDGDGFGDEDKQFKAVSPQLVKSIKADCDDVDANINPNATEIRITLTTTAMMKSMRNLWY